MLLCKDLDGLLDKYRKYVNWVENTPDGIFEDWINGFKEVCNNKEEFKEEMMLRLDCKWRNELVNKMEYYLNGEEI